MVLAVLNLAQVSHLTTRNNELKSPITMNCSTQTMVLRVLKYRNCPKQ